MSRWCSSVESLCNTKNLQTRDIEISPLSSISFCRLPNESSLTTSIMTETKANRDIFRPTSSWRLYDGILQRVQSTLRHNGFMMVTRWNLAMSTKVFSDTLRLDGYMTKPYKDFKTLSDQCRHDAFLAKTLRTHFQLSFSHQTHGRWKRFKIKVVNTE